MAVKNIIHDQIFLMQRSTLADKNDMHIAIDLRDTLLANREKAAGLAANMIGENKKIIAFYVGNLPLVMVNPQVIKKRGKYTAQEGCLSLSGKRKAERYKKITVTYQDLNLKQKTENFSEFIAETIQHEIDHCDGILI